MFTNMRSNDVIVGLPHDIFCFTMLQEIIARSLSVGLGTYKHTVGSLHIYNKSIENAMQYLDEGWQSTEVPMPKMPWGAPWPAIASLLKAESVIRSGEEFDSRMLEDLDAYWADLIRLLQVFRYSKDKDKDKDNMTRLHEGMSSKVYDPFIVKRIGEL